MNIQSHLYFKNTLLPFVLSKIRPLKQCEAASKFKGIATSYALIWVGWEAGSTVSWSSLSWLSGSLTTFRWLSKRFCRRALPVCSSSLKKYLLIYNVKLYSFSCAFPKYKNIYGKYKQKTTRKQIQNTKNPTHSSWELRGKVGTSKHHLWQQKEVSQSTAIE